MTDPSPSAEMPMRPRPPAQVASPLLLAVIVSVVAVAGTIAWQFKPDLSAYESAWVVYVTPGSSAAGDDALRGAIENGCDPNRLRIRLVSPTDSFHGVMWDTLRTDVALSAQRFGQYAHTVPSHKPLEHWLQSGGAIVFTGASAGSLGAWEGRMALGNPFGGVVAAQPGLPAGSDQKSPSLEGPIALRRAAGPAHPLVEDLPERFEWPGGLVHVQTDSLPSGEVLLWAGDRPVLVVRRIGRGRVVWSALDGPDEVLGPWLARLLMWAGTERMRADAVPWVPKPQ